MKQFIYLKDVATLRLDEGMCNGCGMCLQVCPHEVFKRHDGLMRIEYRDACMECGACRLNCPSGAIHVSSGVGCAAAVINALLGRKDASCCNLDSDCGSKGGDFPVCC